MKDKCHVFLVSNAGSKLLKASYNSDDMLLEYREKFFTTKKSRSMVPLGVKPVPFGKRQRCFFVNAEVHMAFSPSEVLVLDKEAVALLDAKIDLVNKQNFWKRIGGRKMTLTDMLIMLAAGYGFIRFLERWFLGA